MSYQGRYSKQTQQPGGKKKTGLIVALAIVAVLLIAIIVGVLYVNGRLNLLRRPGNTGETLTQDQIDSMIGNLDDETVATEPEATKNAAPVETGEVTYKNTGKITNILLVGQDYRPGEDGRLSDSMILCTLNKETKTLTMTSILRDTYIKMADYKEHTCGKNRINITYALGYSWGGEQGAFDMLDMTIENNFGVHVDYNVEVGFDAFIKIIDEIGGVTVEMDDDEAAYMTKLDTATRSFEAGSANLNGIEALGFARMRHATNADSDMNRGARQRRVITAIVDKCRTMSLGELDGMIKVLLPEVLTDMSNSDIASLALEVLPMIADLKVENNQCPAEGTYSGQIVDISGVSSAVLIPDVAKNKELLMAIAEADQVENLDK